MKLYKQFPRVVQRGIEGYLDIANKIANWFEDDNTPFAELRNPEIITATSLGMGLKGYEPVGTDKIGRVRFKYQEWWITWQ